MVSEKTSRAKPSRSLPRQISRQDDAIIEATWAYYHDGLNQNDIAARLGVSRASVVNYLTEARRRDYVRITLNSEIFLNHELSERLKEKYGLAEVLVVPSDPTGQAGSSERVARATADWLPQLLEPGDKLGIAWGETIYRVAEVVPHLTVEDVTVVQLVGSRAAGLGYAAEVCSATIARHFGASVINLHVPLIVSTEGLAKQLRDEPDIADQLKAVNDCNKVLFACGTVGDNSHIARTRILSRETLAKCREKGAAGVICARLIDAEGTPIPTEIDDRMIGVTLEQMRSKEMGLLVASGPERVRGAKAAILGGYTSHLVTCSNTAQLLME
ncbi:DNA-binding transcriptional regulator LsrR, DeoR family [Cohaesibacter sp. ES.047]|uniref:sugar-binding transcriptional regulator n=1 Tax=Cohaesibacter sp. ES.047 TaxID=1798205 RepID=UPI000BBFCE7D|nr:sugar-binding transcriptional regulator [Cohaesibacter sp. ES.047]SNY90235.1 DNA-binding transcriptional regulator LsrR, DeoR family [Cohaesibacter sp. ES.047]